MERELDLSYQDFYIGEKRRKISCPSSDLKQYQRSKLKELEETYQSLISGSEIENVAHGFIRNRNCASCAIQHIGYEMTIMMDISKFFDSVTRAMISNVDVKSAQDKYLFHQNGYTAQGFPTSPILANIASIPMLEQIKSFLKSIYKEKFVFTIYADDIQISINRILPIGTREENIIIKNVIEIAKNYNLTINKNKTRIRYAKYGFRRILGINVGSDGIRASRKTMKKLRAAQHQENIFSIKGLLEWAKCPQPNKIKHIERKQAKQNKTK